MVPDRLQHRAPPQHRPLPRHCRPDGRHHGPRPLPGTHGGRRSDSSRDSAPTSIVNPNRGRHAPSQPGELKSISDFSEAWKPQLQLNGVWHRYQTSQDQNWTLQNVSLQIRRGELVGLLGPSGCGKTTLLRMIAGFEKPARGSITMNGDEVATPSRQIAPEKRSFGMVFQDCALFPHLATWQNVCFGLRKRDDISRAQWLLELVGLSDLKQRYPHELSGGQRQRLALARALAPGSSLILLDEPSQTWMSL